MRHGPRRSRLAGCLCTLLLPLPLPLLPRPPRRWLLEPLRGEVLSGLAAAALEEGLPAEARDAEARANAVQSLGRAALTLSGLGAEGACGLCESGGGRRGCRVAGPRRWRGNFPFSLEGHGMVPAAS